MRPSAILGTGREAVYSKTFRQNRNHGKQYAICEKMWYYLGSLCRTNPTNTVNFLSEADELRHRQFSSWLPGYPRKISMGKLENFHLISFKCI